MSRSEKSREAGRGYGEPRHFTPAASEAGDVPAGAPPTYAESVGPYSVSDRPARQAYSDNKVQVDDDLHGSSADESDDSNDTLGDLADDDETAWRLDDEAAEPPSYEDATNVPTEDELVREILASQHHDRLPANMPSLPYPIIVPQRNPHKSYRGFVRAYAPILDTVGIDQNTFMSFLKNLHRSTRINPWYTAVMVSSTTIDSAPSAVAMAVATAMQYEGSSGSTDTRKTNNFLDRMNAELFKPAGCYAFITRYQEVKDAPAEQSGMFGIAAANVDLTTNRVVPKYDRGEAASTTDLTNLTTRLKLFRMASDVVNTAHQTALASLTFPYADGQGEKKDVKAAEQVGDQKVESAEPQTWASYGYGLLQSVAGGVMAVHEASQQRRAARSERRHERWERRRERRQERYERHIGRSHKRMERNVARFENRYGRAPNGISLSGQDGATPIGRSSLGKTSDILYDQEDEARSEVGPSAPRRRHEHPRRQRTKGMSEGVLYLMIVALPKERELANARAMLQGE